jgi:hypothetical protein
MDYQGLSRKAILRKLSFTNFLLIVCFARILRNTQLFDTSVETPLRTMFGFGESPCLMMLTPSLLLLSWPVLTTYACYFYHRLCDMKTTAMLKH